MTRYLQQTEGGRWQECAECQRPTNASRLPGSVFLWACECGASFCDDCEAKHLQAHKDHPMVPCTICGKPTCTAADDECDGVELHAGGWVCSHECWDKAVQALEDEE